MAVLIADDDKSITLALELLLQSNDIETAIAWSPEEVLATVESADIDLVVMDMNYCKDTTSGMEGLELITALKERYQNLPLVVMTGWGTIELAVEAMRRGANDFVEKPWDNNRMLAIVNNQLKLSASMSESRLLRAENALLRSSRKNLVFSSASERMKNLYSQVEKFAASEMDILITGENGTGKSQLAKEIHRLSSRANGPFIVVDMGSLSEGTFESEMFGHKKGAFTDAKKDHVGRIEMANGGTLFLDEIGNTSLKQQSKLLSVLEERVFTPVGDGRVRKSDFRVIAATNADLDELVALKEFRQDLFFRINHLSIEIPPLRERVEDIPELVDHFVEQACLKNKKAIAGIYDDALQALKNLAWPGNIRELRYLLERAVILSTSNKITLQDLQIENPTILAEASSEPLDEMTLAEAEKYLIEAALMKHEGNVINAAKSLGLTRSSFYRRIDKFGIKV